MDGTVAMTDRGERNNFACRLLEYESKLPIADLIDSRFQWGCSKMKMSTPKCAAAPTLTTFLFDEYRVNDSLW